MFTIFTHIPFSYTSGSPEVWSGHETMAAKWEGLKDLLAGAQFYSLPFLSVFVIMVSKQCLGFQTASINPGPQVTLMDRAIL